MKYVSLCICQAVCLLLCTLCMGCNEPVAVDNVVPTAEPSTPVVLENPADVADDGDADSNQEDDEPSALDKARDIFRQADETGDGVKKWLGDRIMNAADGGQDAADGSLEWANQTFELLKKQGLTTADTAQEWVVEDYNSMGAWEYKVVKLFPNRDAEKTEAQLNKLGSQRWECFNVTPPLNQGSHYMYHFKRQKKSYMKSLPLKDILRLVPLMGGGDEQ